MQDLEELYQNGYEVGVTGMITACPENLYQNPDHSFRDAWVNGYLTGRKEYWRASKSHNRLKGGLDALDELWGTLWVDPKENGAIVIRDCEGGTRLASVYIDGEITIKIYQNNLTTKMAYLMGRAISKAAALGYRIEQSRLLKF